ncbi:hypothetical protein HPB48_000432 [Haemaphysalis longicornis]|uniref:Uncharacterized protein n=1 Tax=Haemaphysalis longicornis TaxID=44386 RepID=A0A9J6FUP9_HAELO|nr:hypothetical protein HPB48_000432 [Haemaphysalis longicornis]
MGPPARWPRSPPQLRDDPRIELHRQKLPPSCQRSRSRGSLSHLKIIITLRVGSKATATGPPRAVPANPERHRTKANMVPATTSMLEDKGKIAALLPVSRPPQRAPELPTTGVKIILRPKNNLDLRRCSHAPLHDSIRHGAGVTLEDAL